MDENGLSMTIGSWDFPFRRRLRPSGHPRLDIFPLENFEMNPLAEWIHFPASDTGGVTSYDSVWPSWGQMLLGIGACHDARIVHRALARVMGLGYGVQPAFQGHFQFQGTNYRAHRFGGDRLWPYSNKHDTYESDQKNIRAPTPL